MWQVLNVATKEKLECGSQNVAGSRGSVGALASAMRGPPRPARGPPVARAPVAPARRRPNGQCPLRPALDITLRDGQEAVVQQKALGRVAALEAPGLEVPPSVGPLLARGQRRRPGRPVGARGSG